MVFLRLDYLRLVNYVVSFIFVGSNWHLDLFEAGYLTSWMEICLERSELDSRKEKYKSYSLACRICCLGYIMFDAHWTQLSVQNKVQFLKDSN